VACARGCCARQHALGYAQDPAGVQAQGPQGFPGVGSFPTPIP